jgi:hypothetical protein
MVVDDDDGVLSLGGHSFAIVEVYFGMLKTFLGLVWSLLCYYHL